MPKTASAVALVAAVLAAGCKGSPDPEAEIRAAWVREQAFAGDAGGAWYLTSNEEIFFDDGWFPMEAEPFGDVHGKTWRWMGRASLLRLRAHDTTMYLTIAGWVPIEVLKSPPLMTLRWNGARLESFLAPRGHFVKIVVVTPEMQRGVTWGDFAMETSSTGQPSGDPRELGYAVNEVHWSPLPPPGFTP